jgi:hypothetical protein
VAVSTGRPQILSRWPVGTELARHTRVNRKCGPSWIGGIEVTQRQRLIDSLKEYRVAVLVGALTVVAGVGLAQEHRSPLVIPAAEFHNDGLAPESYTFNTTGGYISGHGYEITMVAPVYLPHSVTVERLEVVVADGSNACVPANVSVGLLAFDYSGGSYYWMAGCAVTVDSLTQMQVLSDNTVSFATIDNLTRGYFVRVKLCSQLHAFQAVRIYYTE